MAGVEKPFSDWTALEFYNAGTEALQAGQAGKAVAYLEKARRAFPHDHDIHTNLEIAHSRLLRQLGQTETEALDPGRSAWDFFSEPPRSSQISGALGIVTLLVVILAWRDVRRGLLQRVAIYALTVALTGGMGVTLQFRTADPVFALLQDVTVKSGPAEHFSPLASLKTGQLVREDDAFSATGHPGWKLIRYEDDSVGWIPDSALLRLSADSNKPKI